MTTPKKKPSDTAKTKPSDNVKENIRRQRFRSEGSREASFFETARKAEVFSTYKRFEKSEFPITAPELARLAMARKGTGELSNISDSDLDDLLQFIARCQWRIEATKHFWGGYGAAFYEEDRNEPEPTEVVKRIREECAPVTFERSMILLGSPDRPKKEKETATDARTRNFRPIFWEWFIGGHRLSYLSGGEGLEEGQPWAEPKNHEIRAAWETRQREGWPDLHVLEGLARYAEAWRKRRRAESARTNASKPRNRKPS